MKQASSILNRLLHPPLWALIGVPAVSFASLAAVFACHYEDHALAYLIYSMSAYSLVLWAAAAPKLATQVKSAAVNSRLMQKVTTSEPAMRYLSDLAFRGSVSLHQGMAVNFLYAVFRVVVGIRCASVWFVSMAAYYLALGVLRAYLVVGYRRRTPARECRCYRRTAWLLFLLNIPMGGMIVLMVRTNSGFSYPGYVIYLSALYTFYTMITSVLNLIKFRRLGSPILSAAKVLNFVAALMSILSLQTAMIARFSAHGEGYRRMMNAITGGFVYGIVVLIAVYMLFHSRTLRKKVEPLE